MTLNGNAKNGRNAVPTLSVIVNAVIYFTSRPAATSRQTNTCFMNLIENSFLS